MVVPRLLGYDLRHAGDGYVDTWWSRERRETFLLDPAITWPKSVDRFVWPSLFALPGAQPPDPPPMIEVPASGLSWHLNAFSCWPEAEAMWDCYRAAQPTTGEPVSVALTLYPLPPSVSAGLREEMRGPYDLLEPIAAPTGDHWRLIGYDVADSGQTSGLANCGYRESERAEWRSRWRDHLNRDGLFDEFSTAMEFRDASDVRIPEHRPFFVYGLFGCAPPVANAGTA